jgi:drug/metabolite transporter (DMT)-like permease
MVEMTAPPPARRGLGYGAAALAVGIWAGWILLVRATLGPAQAVALAPYDIALLRYGAPALLFAPIWLRLGVLPAGLSRWRLAAMTLGWGAPFALLASEGLTRAEPGFVAALVPGGMPLWAAGIMAVLGARFAPRALLGLALIGAAALTALGGAWMAGAWANLSGAPWLVAASISWAAYAVAYRGSGLSPIEATALVAFWSTVLLAPLGLLMESRFLDLPPVAMAEQALLQGVVSGVVSVAAFALAIRELGAAQAATFSALVPVLAALGGWAILGETPGWTTAAAIALATAGVALVNMTPPRG